MNVSCASADFSYSQLIWGKLQLPGDTDLLTPMHIQSLNEAITILQVGSRIVHVIPSDDFKKRLETRLATPYISKIVYQKLTRDTVDDVCGFLASTRGDHACSAMRGQLFESFVMSRQSESQGRTFRVKLPQGFSVGKFEFPLVQAVIVLRSVFF